MSKTLLLLILCGSLFLLHWQPGEIIQWATFQFCALFRHKVHDNDTVVCKNRLTLLHAILSNYVAIKIPETGLLKQTLGKTLGQYDYFDLLN